MRRCASTSCSAQDVDLAIDTLKEIGAALREDDKFKDGILSDFSFWGVDALDGSAVTLAGQIQCRDSARWGVQREFNRRILDQFTRARHRDREPAAQSVDVGPGKRDRRGLKRMTAPGRTLKTRRRTSRPPLRDLPTVRGKPTRRWKTSCPSTLSRPAAQERQQILVQPLRMSEVKTVAGAFVDMQ